MTKWFSKIDDYEPVDDDTITLRHEDTITHNNIKYRKFKNESQKHIDHYILDLKDCKKIYLHRIWWYECKPHSPCRLNCVDSKGRK